MERPEGRIQKVVRLLVLMLMKSLASSILSWESLDRELASKEMQVQQSKEPAGEKKSKSWLNWG